MILVLISDISSHQLTSAHISSDQLTSTKPRSKPWFLGTAFRVYLSTSNEGSWALLGFCLSTSNQVNSFLPLCCCFFLASLLYTGVTGHSIIVRSTLGLRLLSLQFCVPSQIAQIHHLRFFSPLALLCVLHTANGHLVVPHAETVSWITSGPHSGWQQK